MGARCRGTLVSLAPSGCKQGSPARQNVFICVDPICPFSPPVHCGVVCSQGRIQSHQGPPGGPTGSGHAGSAGSRTCGLVPDLGLSAFVSCLDGCKQGRPCSHRFIRTRTSFLSHLISPPKQRELLFYATSLHRTPHSRLARYSLPSHGLSRRDLPTAPCSTSPASS